MEQFKVDNISAKMIMDSENDDLEMIVLLTNVDAIRKLHGAYIWAYPIKWYDNENNLHKQIFTWDIEFNNGVCKDYGCSDKEELPTYKDALKNAIDFFKGFIDSTTTPPINNIT